MSDRPRRRVNLRPHALQHFSGGRHLLARVPLLALLACGLLAGLPPRAGAADPRPLHPKVAAAWHASVRPPAPHPPRRTVVPPASPADIRLLGFWRALEAVESGRRREPVVVLQIGDSHSANDAFAGRLRELFQARFGAAGRGVLPAGIPYTYFRPAGVQVTASGWDRIGGKPVLPGRDSPRPALIGLTGTRMHTAGMAEMTYRVDQPADLQRVAIEILQQPGGGTLSIGFDGRPTWLLGTAAVLGRAAQAVWLTLPPAGGAGKLTLRAGGDGPVDLLAVDLRRAPPRLAPIARGGMRAGVIWANLGTIGAQVSQVTSWDPDILAADLRALHPDLIVLAFGTNEGFASGLDSTAYETAYAEAARRLAQGGATLAVIEPPDGNRRVPRAVAGLAAIAAAAGPAAVAVVPELPPGTCGLAAAEADRPAGRWEEPPALPLVRRAQDAVAHRFGWFSWDWAAAMGGDCAMARWAAATPPLAWPDHVHLREAGARQTAEALFSALMSGYGRSRGHGP